MSQDYFLSKIYESVRNKATAPSNKPQNLKQAYYRVILEQINEDADILMQDRDAEGKPVGDVKEFKVSDKVANKIKSEIRKEMQFGATEEKTNLNEIIKKVLISSNWGKTADLNLLIEIVANVFNKEELVIDNIVKYPQLIESSKNLLEEKLINNPSSKTNLKNLIPDWFNSFFETINGYDIVNALWDVVPNTKPASGRGELALSLISSTNKSTQGDLLVNGSLVELKGSGGTMGGDNHIIDTAKELNEILAGDVTNLSIENRKKKFIDDIGKIPEKYSDFKKNFIKLIQDKSTEEEIKNFIAQSPLTEKGKESLIKSYVSFLSVPKFNYRDSLLAFFSRYELLTDDQLAEGIYAGRNFKKTSSPDNIKNKIKDILVSDKNSFFDKQHSQKNKFTYSLACLISALHVCCYQEIYKFKGIIFANDTNKDMIYLNFVSDSVPQNLENVYKFLKENKVVISLSMTQIQKSASLTFFK